jgi:hypothetical protein
MSMTPEQQKAIVEQESAWIDSSFASLDLSQFPALAPVPPEETHDDRFAKSWQDSGLSRSARDLRTFIENPDLESLDRVGRETGIEEYAAEVRDRRSEIVAQAFKRKCPNYIPTDENSDKMIQTMAFNFLSTSQQNGDTNALIDRLAMAGKWTVENLEACYLRLRGEGLLQVPDGEPRELSEAERLHVSRLAMRGETAQAIAAYFEFALDEELTMDQVNDPSYRRVCDDACFYVFETATADYAPTEERRAYLLSYAAGRPLTLVLLQNAWESCKSNEKRYERGELLEQYQRPQDTAPTLKDLDALDDSSFERLYRDAMRAHLKSIRGAGVLA